MSDSGLSRSEMNRGMRAFIFVGMFMAVWSRFMGVGFPLFTKYLLWLGATDSFIGLLVSLTSGALLIQLFSLQILVRFRNQKLVIVCLLIVEVILRWSILFIALPFFDSMRMAALAIAVVLAGVFGYSALPVWNSWFGACIPDKMRGRYMAKRININTIAGAITVLIAAQFVDKNLGYNGFFIVFTIASLFGIMCYLAALRAPFPSKMKKDRLNPLGILRVAHNNPDFKPFLWFFMFHAFAMSLAMAYQSVFMIKYVKLSLTTIEMLRTISMLTMIMAYPFWGKLIDRYGNKPILQTMIIPAMLIPVLFIFNTEGFYPFLIAAMPLWGIVASGLSLSSNTMLFSLISKHENQPALMAASLVFASIGGFVGPLVGSVLSKLFENLQFTFVGIPMSSIHIIFLSASVLMLPSLFLSHRLRDSKAIPPRKFVGELLRGNIFNYAYGSFMFSRAVGVDQRIRAALRIGRSQSPMAVTRLAEVLDDPEISIRKAAALALGDTRHSDAVPILLKQLDDKESHIRHEAAKALGKLGSEAGTESLVRALDDEDPQVRASAVTSLADIGGNKAREVLLAKFSTSFDRFLFPLLIQSLSRLGETAIVPQAVKEIDRYRSLVVQRQILHSICRLFGDRRDFYRALMMNEWERTNQIFSLMTGIRKKLSILDRKYRKEYNALITDVNRVLELFHTDEFNIPHQLIKHLAHQMKSIVNSKIPENPLAVKALETVEVFYSTKASSELKMDGLVFSILCIRSAVDKLIQSEQQ